MIDDMIRSTKKIIHWFDAHKVELLKGVLGMLVIGFSDGKVTIDVSDTFKPRYKTMPDVKPKYYDTNTDSARAAIDMFKQTGLETSSDYYRLEAVEKIQEILSNTTRLTESTKTYAINAIGEIRGKCTSEYYRREINDVVVDILEL